MNGIRGNLEPLDRREEFEANQANRNAFLTDPERIKTCARDLRNYLRQSNEDTLTQIFHLVIQKIHRAAGKRHYPLYNTHAAG